MTAKNKSGTFLIVMEGGHIIDGALDANVETGYGIDDLDEFQLYILPIRCNNCQSISILSNPFPESDGSDVSESHTEYRWTIFEDVKCETCHQRMEIEIDMWHSGVGSASQVMRNEGCDPVTVHGIEWLRESFENQRKWDEKIQKKRQDF